MNKIVIACDSFKGCLSSAEVARCCTEAVADVLPTCNAVGMAVGDGGEGTTAALVTALGGRLVHCRVCDPLLRPVMAEYCISGDGTTAVIDMAAAAGLPLLSECERDPEQTSTYGVGQMIADAVARGVRRVIVGLGGSATNDAGLGMLTALGYRFFDSCGEELRGVGGDLARVRAYDDSSVPEALSKITFEAACDVSNPFYGHAGAAYVFARQKGADEASVARLDAGLQHFAALVASWLNCDMQQIAGAGAAGGLGGSLAAFLHARLRRGVDLVLDATGFDAAIEGADLIITGEGHIDRQTLMGKVPSGVLTRGLRAGVPVVAIAGLVDDEAELQAAGFASIVNINAHDETGDNPLDKAVAMRNLRNTLCRLLT